MESITNPTIGRIKDIQCLNGATSSDAAKSGLPVAVVVTAWYDRGCDCGTLISPGLYALIIHSIYYPLIVIATAVMPSTMTVTAVAACFRQPSLADVLVPLVVVSCVLLPDDGCTCARSAGACKPPKVAPQSRGYGSRRVSFYSVISYISPGYDK